MLRDRSPSLGRRPGDIVDLRKLSTANVVTGHDHCMNAMDDLAKELSQKVKAIVHATAQSTSTQEDTRKAEEALSVASTVVLFHEGVGAHRVLEGHTEQNGRVVKCFELLSMFKQEHEQRVANITSQMQVRQMQRNSFELQTFSRRSEVQLALPSLVVLRLVHSGVYLERITNVCRHASKLSTFSPTSGKPTTMAVVPMAYSDHEMDGDEDIAPEYYDCQLQIQKRVEQNYEASDFATTLSSSSGSNSKHGKSKADDDDDVMMQHDRHVSNHKRNGVKKSVHGPSRKAANLLAKVGVSDMIRSGVIEPGPILVIYMGKMTHKTTS